MDLLRLPSNLLAFALFAIFFPIVIFGIFGTTITQIKCAVFIIDRIIAIPIPRPRFVITFGQSRIIIGCRIIPESVNESKLFVPLRFKIVSESTNCHK